MVLFIDRLFPVEQLEALDNKWPESANKRRKLDYSINQTQTQVQQPQPSRRQHSQHGKPSASMHVNKPTGTLKRVNTDSMAARPSRPMPNVKSNSSTAKSCLPTFIEPSIRKVYLHNLHPKDRPRHSEPTIPRADTQRPATKHATTIRHEEYAVFSPGSLTSDSAFPASSGDTYLTPTPGNYAQLRSGRFSHLIDGLRLTDHERDLMQDLLRPAPEPVTISTAATGQKREVPTNSEVEIVPDEFYTSDQSLLEKMFPPSVKETILPLEYDYVSNIQATTESDVHSSGLSPISMEAEDESPAGIVMPANDLLSVDGFFDLEEAASALSPLSL
ncbi:hypothetical protein LTR10_024296 [Elasticomyces elasticus]|uniref:Uncharacterized protein n=1 Tax=Exophiala sideris TaxID=1016849 RepID=A0ABR0IW31_9EURO|nr:hypothetical protein LTR10_024296 [Elasticomyces elasticus]KAK5020797.1 hypothetical protein LTS07_011421 [Exophiala sideris]KAK5022843.1 hypothetical protein LTR13_011396 [Exophiala sideris]KAK5048124.1 hypothetical protein LTR69_011436 [Exophiala sideris]KAK5176026.1 hypothetical protein LTR44_011421 [Eurotiomycetes sp. CCFEE 6388]